VDAINPLTANAVGTSNVEAFREARSEQAFKDLEGLFLKELLKEMRKSIPDDGIFKKSHATEIYEEMLDDVYSKAMADSGQFGIAKQIAAQVQLQEEGGEFQPESFELNEDIRPEALKEWAPPADKTYMAPLLGPGSVL